MDKYEDIVMTTRIRLARNIKGHKYPNNMIDKEKQKILEYIKDRLQDKYTILELNNMDNVTKKSLVERHIISKELLQSNNTALIMDEKNNITTMVNEEDHLRIQAFEENFNVDEAYKKIVEMDSEISKNVDYSYSKEYGYLTACPTCLGTGMRVSVMMHLPSLEKIGALEKIFNEISHLGISIRGIYGENTSGEGAIYQISNQRTLGIKEEDIIEQVKQVTNYIVKQERKAREILKNRIEIKNEIMRSYGIAKYAITMTQKEAMRILSNIRMGINMQWIEGLRLSKIDQIIENIGINTLRKNLKENFSKEEVDLKRADYIKNNI